MTECKACHQSMSIPDGYEATEYCNPCAQARVTELEAALREFKQTRGCHNGEHDSSLTVCSKCNESYVVAEAKLDAKVSND